MLELSGEGHSSGDVGINLESSAGSSRLHLGDDALCTHLLCVLDVQVSGVCSLLQSSEGNTAVSLLEKDCTFKTGFKEKACHSFSVSSLPFFPLYPWSGMDSLFPLL